MSNISNLYIHVPFCQSKCDYCAFYSIPQPTADQISAYLNRLECEIREKRDSIGTVDTLFIGGGTPTLFSKPDLSAFLTLIDSSFEFAPKAECTIESNPETLSDEKINTLSSSFINRLSIGIQSFNPVLRKTIGRIGSLSDLRKKIALLTQSGIENISFDMIYGIPGQTLHDWNDELRQALAFPIHHLSAYALSVEDMSRLALNNTASLLDDDLEADMWQLAGDYLEKNAGVLRYEISNYAHVGFECRHNLSFWSGNTYMGFGPAAVSFTGDKRLKNADDFSLWLDKKGVEENTISTAMRARELFSLRMRMPEGIEGTFFEKIIGSQLGEFFSNEIETLMRDRLIIYDGERVVPTQKGLLFADQIATSLI